MYFYSFLYLVGCSQVYILNPLSKKFKAVTSPGILRRTCINVEWFLYSGYSLLKISPVFVYKPVCFILRMSQVHEKPSVSSFKNWIARLFGIGKEGDVSPGSLFFQNWIIDTRVPGLGRHEYIIEFAGDGVVSINIIQRINSEDLFLIYRLFYSVKVSQCQSSPANSQSGSNFFPGVGENLG